MVRISCLFVCLLLVLVKTDLSGQTTKPTPTPKVSTEPVLVPLTEVERKLDLQNILTNQPDYVADQGFFYWEGFGGFSAKSHVARKGNRAFKDTGAVKVISDGDKIFELYDSTKTYDERAYQKRTFQVGNGVDLDLSRLLAQKDVSYSAIGSQIVNGHNCLKIEAKIKDNKAQIFLYSAGDLKYLIIAIEVLTPPRRSTQQLMNISLDVPDKLVEIPADYKPIAKHIWTRLDSAKVTLEGRTPEKYSVFRSEDGNQLFVSVYEPYPWNYLVFLKEGVSQIAYQGMLVTKKGDFAWQSEEKEATSNQTYKPYKDSYCKNQKCPKTIAGSSFVQFPSVDERSLIRVEW